MDQTNDSGQDRTLPGGRVAPTDGEALSDLRLMLTAREAFPYLETMFLEAQERVAGSFRIFEPETPLLSEEALKVGRTWADLFVHTLKRGVRITLILSDFDPVGAPELHASTHRSLRRFAAAAEEAGVRDRLDVVAHRHPAVAGPIWRLFFAPVSRKRLREALDGLNRQGHGVAAKRLDDMPDLKPLVTGEPGRFRPRRFLIPELHPCTHHQKIAAADATRFYVGGIDVNERREDGLHHDRAAERTWHDVALGATGPVAAAAEAHIDGFRAEVDRQSPPGRRPGLLRTLSARRRGLGHLRFGPETLVSEIAERTQAEIAEAQQLVYLETQFLRDSRFARALAARGRQNRDLGLIAVLPAAPEEVAFDGDHGLGQRFGEHMQAKCVSILTRAFGDRATFVSPAQCRGLAPDGSRSVLCGAPIVYVHSKVSIVDGRVAVVSSANLNGRSHRWDTEAGLVLDRPDQAQLLLDRLMRHWLPDDPAPECLDPARAPAAWRDLAEANRHRQPQERHGFLLPYPARAPRRFGRPIPFMPQEMV